MLYLENTTQSQQVYIPRQVIQTATTREINYITSGDVINIVDEKLEPYYTSAETDTQIENAVAAESARCEETYAKIEDIPDVSNLVTSADVKTQVEDYHYITSGQAQEQINQSLSGYATEQWVEDKHYLTEHQSLSAYSTTEQMNSAISAATDDMATKTWVGEQGYLTEHQSLSAYSTTEQIEGMIANESARTEETYAKISDVPDLDNYYTSAETDTQIENAIAIESARCESTYLKEHQSLAGLFNSVDYVSSAKTIVFYDKTNTQVGVVDATDFIKDGMVDNVYISGETLFIVFNTDAGKETIELDLTQIFDANNYYTKDDIDNKHFVNSGEVKTQIEAYNYVNSGDVEYQINDYDEYAHQVFAEKTEIPDVSNLVTSADVETQITGKNYVTSATVQTQIDGNLSAYTPTSGFATINGSGITDGGNLVIQGGGSSYTAGDGIDITNDVISVTGRQETLVSGTNIKTINNQSLLGSGNIEIQGGGGGNANIIELTQAEYDALTAYTEDALYVITDAEEVDLNDYATSGDIQTLSAATVTALGNKADKVNIASNPGYMRFPNWNSQGIITGYTYEAKNKGFRMNGSTQDSTLVATNSTSLPMFYAPTTAGDSGQILQSNGSGAPSWSSFKFWYGSQSDYDAITRKDSTTIYFITD